MANTELNIDLLKLIRMATGKPIMEDPAERRNREAEELALEGARYKAAEAKVSATPARFLMGESPEMTQGKMDAAFSRDIPLSELIAGKLRGVDDAMESSKDKILADQQEYGDLNFNQYKELEKTRKETDNSPYVAMDTDETITGGKIKAGTPTTRGQIKLLAAQRRAEVMAQQQQNKPLSRDSSAILAITKTLRPEVEALKAAFRNDFKGSLIGLTSGANRRLVKLVDNVADKVGRIRSQGAVNKQEEERFKRQIYSWLDIPFGNSEDSIAALDGILAEADEITGGIRPNERQAPASKPSAIPKSSKPSPGSAPEVGSMFNGEKVRRVTRIQ